MYELCPEPYYSNCALCMVGCSSCKASCPSIELPFRYKPINPILSRKKHPCIDHIDKEKKERNKQIKLEKADDIRRGRSSRNSGARNEKRMASKLNAEFTELSGAKYGDGDLIVTAGPLSFHMECKYRGNGKNESGPTKKELEKAITHGVTSFCTTSPTYPKGIITLSFDTFNELLNLVRESYAK